MRGLHRIASPAAAPRRGLGLFLLLGALVSPLLAGLCAAASQDTRFDAARDLEGYAAARESAYAGLYAFDGYERWNGQTVSAPEVREIRLRWEEERLRVEAEIAALEADPEASYRYFLRERLAEHPYFGRQRFEWLEGPRPFLLLVQPLRQARRGYEEELVEFFGPALEALDALFREDFAGPLGLSRRPDKALRALIVLSERAEYERYLKTLSGPALYFARAQYDADLDVVVCHLEDGDVDDALARRPVLHEMVHALRRSHAARAEPLAEHPWFDEGVASFVSSRAASGESGVASSGSTDLPDDALCVRAIVELWNDPDQLRALLLPLERLAAIGSYEGAYTQVRDQADGLGLDAPAQTTSLLALYAQAGLWVHYLARAEAGRHAPALREYLQVSLAGGGGPADLERVLGVELAELDARFLDYLRSHVDGWSQRREEADLDVSFRLSSRTRRALEEGSDARRSGLAALAPDATSPELRFAVALWKARRGAWSSALRDVQALQAYETDEEVYERLRRERTRLQGMVDLRREFLEHLRDAGLKLNVELPGGERLVAEVLAVDTEHVELGSNRAGIGRMPLDEFDGLELVRAMRNRRAGFREDWLLGYPFLLAGEKGWKRLVGEGTEEERALRADAEEDYPARLRLARVAGALQELSETEDPDDPAAAEATVGAVAELWKEHADVGLVQARRTPLLELAYRAQASLFPARGLAEIVHGEIEPLEGGRIRLTYDFEEDAQAEDFEEVRYLDDQRWENSIPEDQSIPLEVSAGLFQGYGSICSRHLFVFEGEQVVRLRFQYRSPRRSFDSRVRSMLGICDDGQENYLACDTLGSIARSQRGGSVIQNATAEGTEIFMDTIHEIEIHHDGERFVRTKFDGKPVAEMPCASLFRGSVFLWSNTDCPFEVLDLVIEGALSSSGLQAARADWVRGELAEAGIE